MPVIRSVIRTLSEFMNSGIKLQACLLALLLVQPALAGSPQDPVPAAADQGERIATREEIEAARNPPALLPLRILSYPYRGFTAAMEKGMIAFEKHNLRARIQHFNETLDRRGLAILLGGLGEGTGFGGGGQVTLPAHGNPSTRILGRGTFKGYQEVDAMWSGSRSGHRTALEASYQWRPQENFYGLGQRSREERRSNFALRQSWLGGRYEFTTAPRLRLGAEYRHAWLSTQRGENSDLSGPVELFSELPGFGRPLRLSSSGLYLDADGGRGEYALGGRAHLAASYEHGHGRSRLRYFTYELWGEGRLPVRPGQSALVAQAQAELNRPRGGSDPLPFFVQPHIGGSSTLRGFALDRFYGRNILLATLEYRWRLHPDFQTLLFFDQGQIFDRTRELSWTNWQRGYGFGFRVLGPNGPRLRLEFGWSGDGFTTHLSFGDRERRPLGGPIRYGTYRR